jgi:MHS family proline/betaine transporter-like MFS transporter
LDNESNASPGTFLTPRAPAQTVPKTSLAIAAFSTVVEWYDFTLYLYLAPILARVFFPGSAHSIVVVLAGFALAYLMRPLGAAFFGHSGDRFGRRRTMLWSMELMAIAMLATGLLPTAASIGGAAGALLMILRCVMAFSVGGEYNGVIAYLLEGARPERRGLLTAMAAASSEIGGLLAVAVAALTTTLLDERDVSDWGWRVPFVVGAILAGGVWFARRSMVESPAFVELQRSGATLAHPLRAALRHHKAGVLRAFSISALGSITYYVGITYVPTFLGTTVQAGDRFALVVSTAAALAVVVVTPFVGWASDVFGRRPVLLALAVAGIALPSGLFALMTSPSIVVAMIAAIGLALLAGGVSAVGAVASAEQFPGGTRLSGLALGNTSATVVFGGFAPLAAQLLVDATGWPSSPGILIAATAFAVLPMFWLMPETRPRLDQS